MGIRFDEIDGLIKIHDGIRYFALFDCGWCDKICNRIKYVISEESGVTDSINHTFARIIIDSDVRSLLFIQALNITNTTWRAHDKFDEN